MFNLLSVRSEPSGHLAENFGWREWAFLRRVQRLLSVLKPISAELKGTAPKGPKIGEARLRIFLRREQRSAEVVESVVAQGRKAAEHAAQRAASADDG